MKKILFVCVGNSGRSQMAEAFFNNMAQNKAIAYSAGTLPANKVDQMVIKVMQEVGIDISDKKPKMLTQLMLDNADKVITMGCGVERACPARWIESEDWGLSDPKGKPIEEIRQIRNEVKQRVTKLLTTM